jgi:cytochrome P450
MLPDWFIIMVQPVLQPVVGLRKVRYQDLDFRSAFINFTLQDLASKVREIRDGINQRHKEASHPTIFHEVLNSDLPDAEKTDARLGDEAQLIIAAGLITTSWALTVGSYHLIANPEMLSNLRHELRDSGISADSDVDWRQLEVLPYLNACVHESIRLAHGISTRSPRLAPDTELRYGDYTIPKNTPVSMTNVDILMNEDIFPNPREFRPDRWIGQLELEKYFVPFTKGSRQCLGLK